MVDFKTPAHLIQSELEAKYHTDQAFNGDSELVNKFSSGSREREAADEEKVAKQKGSWSHGWKANFEKNRLHEKGIFQTDALIRLSLSASAYA